MKFENVTMLMLTILLVVGVVFTSCTASEQETPTQIIESIAPQEAFTLIQENQDNPDFVILDVRTPEEFAEEYIENAINIDYHSETFKGEVDKLNRDKTYLIYCRSGVRSRNTLDVFGERNFKEAYNMTGGIIQWREEGLPTIQKTPTQMQLIDHITTQQAFALIQENQDNPDFVIIDVRTSEKFAEGHIENAINMDYFSETFQDELDKLDKNKTYLVYCASGSIGCEGVDALIIMAELNFREVYNILGGINQWKAEGFPIVK